MQAQSMQSKAQIRALLQRFAPKLDASEWAGILFSHLKNNGINDLSLLSPESDYGLLCECADTEEEVSLVVEFLEIVRSHSATSPEGQPAGVSQAAASAQLGKLPTAPPLQQGFPRWNPQQNQFYEYPNIPMSPPSHLQPNSVTGQQHGHPTGEPVLAGLQSHQQPDPMTGQQYDHPAGHRSGNMSGLLFSGKILCYRSTLYQEMYHFGHFYPFSSQTALNQMKESQLQQQQEPDGGLSEPKAAESPGQLPATELFNKKPQQETVIAEFDKHSEQSSNDSYHSAKDRSHHTGCYKAPEGVVLSPEPEPERVSEISRQEPTLKLRSRSFRGRLDPQIDPGKTDSEETSSSVDRKSESHSDELSDDSQLPSSVADEPSSEKSRKKRHQPNRLPSKTNKNETEPNQHRKGQQEVFNREAKVDEMARSNRLSEMQIRNPPTESQKHDTGFSKPAEKSGKGQGRHAKVKIQERSVVSELSLKDYFPEKIRLSQLVRIVDTKPIETATGAKQKHPLKFIRASFRRRRRRRKGDDTFAWNLLRGLMSYDWTVRDLVPKSNSQAEQSATSMLFEGADNDDSEDTLNPMDILFTCYQCCDKEVQQVLCRILFACKLAFPFIYSAEKSLTISNWSLRDIVIEFRDKTDVYISTSLISDQKFKVVSFVRIGELPESKSRLLNSLLNGNDHATFFHRDCASGHTRRVCSNGLVEATVFLPVASRKSFETPFLAANLRGDMLQFTRQGEILSEMSQLMVVFIDALSFVQPECFKLLQKLEERLTLLLVVCKTETSPISKSMFYPEHDAFLQRNKNVFAFRRHGKKSERELCAEVEANLKEQLCQCDGVQLDSIVIQNASLDERDLVSQTKALSQTIMKYFETENISDIKGKHLPLQILWLEYSVLFKVENAAKTAQSEQLKSQASRMKKRDAQLKICERLSEFIVSFINSLVNAKNTKDGQLRVKLLLQWVKLAFDSKSRKLLSGLQKKCHELRDQTQTEQKASPDLAKDLSTAEKATLDASVGLENVFREVGQIFEAAKENSSSVHRSLVKFVEPLPKLFAQLLLWGVPLEILDGDAGNIPSAWISAILNSCQELVGGKKIYVISVLGLQSSGKSTLLNTMFGLKFAVSAGRCTRGAFLQLVPVESGMPFDYIAVIDSEGLRAPELGLDKHHHDNELATLVIGLGDATIINIKGENSAEMKDILQISIHAFIRMKMANRMRDLNRHCIFIHQNVPAVGAKEQMQDAALKMQQRLDAITKEAAEGEGLRNVHRFSDIISFDKESDIFYMSDLWQGDPPMAPVNPGYSQKVSSIKDYLLNLLDGERKHFLNFTEFSTRINELWKAIMSEDFVFSFKNSIELKAYSQMEGVFFEAKNLIEQAADGWLNKEASIQIKKCRDVAELLRVKEQNIRDLSALVGNHLGTSRCRLERFFEEGQYSEYVIQWKERKLIALQNFSKELQQEMRKKLTIMVERHRADTEKEPKKAELERRILARAKGLAEQVRGQNLEVQSLKPEFEKEWLLFMNDLPAELSDEMLNIEMQIQDFLEEQYGNNIMILRYYLERMPINSLMNSRSIQIELDFLHKDKKKSPELIQVQTSWLQKGKKLVTVLATHSDDPDKDAKQEVFQSCNEMLSSLVPSIYDIKRQTAGFQRQFAVTIQKAIRDGVNQQVNGRLNNRGISSTPALEIKLVVHALRFAYPEFVEVDRKFKEGQSLKAKLALSKDQMWNLFQNIIRQQNHSKIAADFCRDHLAIVLKDAIQSRMGGIFKRRVICDIGTTKYQLIVAMLTDYAKKKNFACIIEYSLNPHFSALKWVTHFTEKLLFHRQSGADSFFCQLIQSEFVDKIIESVKNAAEISSKSSKTLQQWIDGFCKEVNELAVLPQNLHNMSQFGSATIEDLMTYLLDGLDKLRSELRSQYNAVDESTVEWHGDKTLYADVLQTLWGCKERCPFCSEPCQKADPNHYESDGSPHCCIQHRPKAVCGTYWNGSNEFVFDTCEYAVRGDSSFNCSLCKRKGKKTDECSSDTSGNAVLDVWHPNKEYKKQFPEWEIVPDATNDSAKFWMWFCWTFQRQLQEKWQKGLAELPPAWKAVSKTEAIDSLRGLLCE